LLPQMDGTIVFAKWCQCATPSNTCFRGPTQSPCQTLYLNWFSHICTAHGRESLYFTMGHLYPPQNRPLRIHGWIWTPISYMLPWANPSPQPKRHLDQFSSFCRDHDRDRYPRPTDRQTDRQTTLLHLITIGHIYVCSTAMRRPNNNKNTNIWKVHKVAIIRELDAPALARWAALLGYVKRRVFRQHFNISIV